MTIETSYNHEFGSGNRIGKIKVSSNFSGIKFLENTIDGNEESRTEGPVDGNKEKYIQWNFDKIILLDEITLIDHYRNSRFEIYYLSENDEWISYKLELIPSYVKITEVPLKKIKAIRLVAKVLDGSFVRIKEIKFKVADFKQSLLIKKDNQYGYYSNGSFQPLGTSYPTKEQFEQYGMSDLSMLEPGDVPVEYEMELTNETDEEKCFSYSFDLSGQHKNIKSIDGITIK